MNLEDDGRPSSVPILHKGESEGYKYLNEQSIYRNHSNAQDLHSVGGNAEGHEQPRRRSKANDLGQKGPLRVRLGFMLRWKF